MEENIVLSSTSGQKLLDRSFRLGYRISVVTARFTAKPPDIDHPYGHSRVEAIATKLVSFIIFFAGAQLALGTVVNRIEGGQTELPSRLAIWVTLVSIAGKSLPAVHKWTVGRRSNSRMLVADAKNMRADIVISVGVLLGLVATFMLGLPIIDAIVALLISVWIMFVAFRIFLDSSTELMEGSKDRDTYQRVFQAVESVPGAEHPHRTRIRMIGAMYVVDLDIEVRDQLLPAKHER